MSDDAWSAGGWPPEHLERLGECPVCASRERSVLLEGLHDDVFRCAPGDWTLHRCDGCGNAYLDPRPDRASIGDAYRSYYTHAPAFRRESDNDLGWLRRWRRRAANGYTNRRYGTRFASASPGLGGLLARVAPSSTSALDVAYRWLPKPLPGSKLLDVGCGNGAFLARAVLAGWDACGVDPDPDTAARIAVMGCGFRRGGIEAYADMPGQFGAVTFSHSIEHVHDPVTALACAHRLLKPGGCLYVDTPDVGSAGFTRHGRCWRGLEAPRHLVLFEREALVNLLARLGFSNVRLHPRYGVSRGMAEASMLMARGRSPYETPPPEIRLRGRWYSILARLQRRSEFITLTCAKGAP